MYSNNDCYFLTDSFKYSIHLYILKICIILCKCILIFSMHLTNSDLLRTMDTYGPLSQESSIGFIPQDRIQIDGNVTVLKQLYENIALSKMKLTSLNNVIGIKPRSISWSSQSNETFSIKQCYFSDIDQDALCICYTETRDFLAAGLIDGTIKLYKLNSKVDVLTLRDTETMQKPSPTTAVQHRPVHKSYPIKRTVTATC